MPHMVWFYYTHPLQLIISVYNQYLHPCLTEKYPPPPVLQSRAALFQPIWPLCSAVEKHFSFSFDFAPQAFTLTFLFRVPRDKTILCRTHSVPRRQRRRKTTGKEGQGSNIVMTVGVTILSCRWERILCTVFFFCFTGATGGSSPEITQHAQMF